MAISAAGIRAASAFVEVRIKDNLINKQLKGLENRLRRFGSEITAIGAKLFAAGGMSLVPFGLSAKLFGDFDNLIQEFKAISKESPLASLSAVEAKIKQIGRTTSYTASQIAEAAIVLSRLGFDTKQIDDSLRAVTNLARATRTELPRAAQIAGDLQRSFGISDLTKFIDQLVQTTNSSSQTLEDMFQSLKQFGPQSKAAGMMVDQVLALNAALADAGIKGTLAGTMIRRMLTNLTDTNRQKYMEDMFGVKTLDVNGDLRPILDIIGELDTELAGLGSGERLGILNKIFEVRGSAAALIAGENLDKIIKKAGELQVIGNVAGETAKKIDSALGNQFKILISAAEGLQIAVGEALKGPLVEAVQIFTALLDKVTKFVEKNHSLIRQMVLVAGAVAIVGAALTALGVTALVVASALGAIRLAFTALLAPFAMFFKLVNVAGGGAFQVIEKVAVAIGAVAGGVKKMAVVVGTIFKTLATGLLRLLRPIASGLLWIGKLAAKAIGAGLVAGFRAAQASLIPFLKYLKHLAITLGSASLFGPFFVKLQLAIEAVGLLSQFVVVATLQLKKLAVATASVAKAFASKALTSFMKFLMPLARLARGLSVAFIRLGRNLKFAFSGDALVSRGQLMAFFRQFLKGASLAFKTFWRASTVLRNIGPILRKLVTGVRAFFKSFAGIKFLVSGFKSFATTIKGAFSGLAGGIGALIGGVSSIIGGIASAIPSLIKWELIFKSIEGIIFTITSLVDNLIASFQGFGNDFSSIVRGITNAFKSGQFELMIEMGAKAFEVVYLRMARFFTGFVGDLKLAFQGFIDGLGALFVKVGHFMKGMFANLISFFGNVMNVLSFGMVDKEKLSGFVKSSIEAVSNISLMPGGKDGGIGATALARERIANSKFANQNRFQDNPIEGSLFDPAFRDQFLSVVTDGGIFSEAFGGRMAKTGSRLSALFDGFKIASGFADKGQAIPAGVFDLGFDDLNKLMETGRAEEVSKAFWSMMSKEVDRVINSRDQQDRAKFLNRLSDAKKRKAARDPVEAQAKALADFDADIAQKGKDLRDLANKIDLGALGRGMASVATTFWEGQVAFGRELWNRTRGTLGPVANGVVNTATGIWNTLSNAAPEISRTLQNEAILAMQGSESGQSLLKAVRGGKADQYTAFRAEMEFQRGDDGKALRDSRGRKKLVADSEFMRDDKGRIVYKPPEAFELDRNGKSALKLGADGKPLSPEALKQIQAANALGSGKAAQAAQASGQVFGNLLKGGFNISSLAASARGPKHVEVQKQMLEVMTGMAENISRQKEVMERLDKNIALG